MELKDKKSFIKSLGYCIAGLKYALNNEANFRREVIMGIIALILCFCLKVSALEFMIVLLLICFVLIMEIINTALEKVVDLYTTKYNELAKIIKDLSAGAVLIMSFFSLIIGIVIFLPKIINLI